MTEPTNKELDAVIKHYRTRIYPQDMQPHFERAIMRAVLAKWGTPAPVGVEPVARLEIGKTKGGVSLTHIAEPAAFQLPEGMYALYTAPQPVGREPMTPEQRDALWEACKFDDGEEWTVDWEQIVDAVERHHGIGIKGGQHGAE